MLLRRDTAPDQNRLALKFFDWCLKKGQDQAKALDYVPLSDPIIRQIGALGRRTQGRGRQSHLESRRGALSRVANVHHEPPAIGQIGKSVSSSHREWAG